MVGQSAIKINFAVITNSLILVSTASSYAFEVNSHHIFYMGLFCLMLTNNAELNVVINTS